MMMAQPVHHMIIVTAPKSPRRKLGEIAKGSNASSLTDKAILKKFLSLTLLIMSSINMSDAKTLDKTNHVRGRSFEKQDFQSPIPSGRKLDKTTMLMNKYMERPQAIKAQRRADQQAHRAKSTKIDTNDSLDDVDENCCPELTRYVAWLKSSNTTKYN